MHVFKAYRLRETVAGSPPPTNDELTPEDLADLMTELSHQAKLGPVISVAEGYAIIVGELQGFIGMEVSSPLIAPVNVGLPAPPAPGNKRG
jgi:hypothetical protein